MQYDWDSLEWQKVVPGYRAKFIHSETMTFALWDIEAGAALPAHNHPHEQVTYLLEGEFELMVDGKNHRLLPGSVVTIAPNAPHSGNPLTPCRILDVFHPRREDYVSGNFSTISKSS